MIFPIFPLYFDKKSLIMPFYLGKKSCISAPVFPPKDTMQPVIL